MIQLRDVSFCYDRQQENGLKSINLNLSQGECIVLCGRSGCGKTTVTRLINGLIPRFYPGKMQGQVLIKGKNIKEIPMYKLAEITGSVFQNPRTQFFNVDTDSEIAFGVENEALPHKQLQVRVQKTIKELNLCNLSGRSIFALSGGEKQQIAFASVYAMEPDLYILDEPSSNLDAAAIQKLKEHLNVIRRQGKTIVIAEHRLYWLLELADRFVYLDKGEIKGIYTPSQLKKLSQQGRNLLGLRSADLSSIRPVLQNHLAAEPILELKEFSLFHNKQKILEGVNLSAAPGDIIAVVGPNGAGKTTLTRAL